MIERRLGLATRPLPFFAGGILLVVGIVWGLNWQWTAQRFSGAVLIQILFPGNFIDPRGSRMLGLLAGLAGLVLLFVFSFTRRDQAASGALWRPRMRFYPLAFLLSLFLIVYGCIFLFDVTVKPDDTPIGFVLFVSLNYAYLTARIVSVVIGFLILLAGGILLLFGSFAPGTQPRFRPAPQRVRAPPEPSPAPPEPPPASEPLVAKVRPKSPS